MYIPRSPKDGQQSTVRLHVEPETQWCPISRAANIRPALVLWKRQNSELKWIQIPLRPSVLWNISLQGLFLSLFSTPKQLSSQSFCIITSCLLFENKLQEWQAHKNRFYKLVVLPQVDLNMEPGMMATLTSWNSLSKWFSLCSLMCTGFCSPKTKSSFVLYSRLSRASFLLVSWKQVNWEMVAERKKYLTKCWKIYSFYNNLGDSDWSWTSLESHLSCNCSCTGGWFRKNLYIQRLWKYNFHGNFLINNRIEMLHFTTFLHEMKILIFSKIW